MVVLHGLVGAPVAELELVSGPAECQGEKLVAHADAHDGIIILDLMNGVDGRPPKLWMGRVTRTVGDHDPVDLIIAEPFDRGVTRQLDEIESLHKLPDDVLLHTAIKQSYLLGIFAR